MLVLVLKGQLFFGIETIIAKEKKLKIGFLMQYFSVRGAHVAVYDYADCNETILNNESYIFYISDNNINFLGADKSKDIYMRFKQRFGANFLKCASLKEMNQIILNLKIDILYNLKSGTKDKYYSSVCKNAVHAVFPPLEPHGDVYASVSSWLSNEYSALHVPHVSHMIRLDDTIDTLHEQLNIPKNAIVFGRHGGSNNFNIEFVKKTIIKAAEQHKNWYFIFLNTNKFCNIPNVIFLPATSDLKYKTKFINTCDAMIHAGMYGETMGLACGEFSIKNKPIISESESCNKKIKYGRAHINILGDKGFFYKNKNELLDILNYFEIHIDEIRAGHWDMYSKNYNPEVIMQQFNNVFIKPLITNKD